MATNWEPTEQELRFIALGRPYFVDEAESFSEAVQRGRTVSRWIAEGVVEPPDDWLDHPPRNEDR